MKFLLLCVLFSSNAFALTTKDVVDSVLTYFPLIEESVLKLESAEGEVEAAKGSFDTKLKHETKLWRQYPYNNEYYKTYLEKQTSLAGTKLVAGHRQGAGKFNYYDLKKETSSAGQAFAGIVFPLLRNLSTDRYRTNLRKRELQKIQAEQTLRMKKLMYVHKSLSVYYKWVLQSKALEISRELLELAEKRHVMISKKFNAGAEEKLKLTDNFRSINKRKSEVIKNEIKLKEYAAELSLFVRDEKGMPKKIEAAKSPEEILKQDITNFVISKSSDNPQIKLLSFERDLLQLEYKLYDQSKLPALNVEVVGAREMGLRRGYGDNMLEVGVNFEFPLENRKAEGKSVAYYYKEKAIQKELEYLEQELTQKFRFAVSASEDSKKRWNVISQEYESTVKVAEGERVKWQNGASDLFVVNYREQDVAEVDYKKWSALYEYHQYQLDAGLFSASLPISRP